MGESGGCNPPIQRQRQRQRQKKDNERDSNVSEFD